MKTITVIGTGYVGLVTGTCFADLGNRGALHRHRPSIASTRSRQRRHAHLRARARGDGAPQLRRAVACGSRPSYEEGLAGSDFAFICVDTPSGATGEADLQVHSLGGRDDRRAQLDHPITIVNRSTVPIGTGDVVAEIVKRTITHGRAVQRGEQPGVPPRGLGHLRLHEPGPRRARLHRSGGRRVGGAAVPAAASANHGHRPAHGRDDQVRLERLPGHQDLVHQRDRRRLREGGRRHQGGGRGHGLRHAHRPGVPERRARLGRQLLPEGRAGARAHGLDPRLSSPAAARGHGDQPRPAAPQ